MSGEIGAGVIVRPLRRDIVKAASKVIGVGVEEIIGEGRYRYIHGARRVVALVARGFGYSSGQIGVTLRRDHTTVLHMLRQGAIDAQRSETMRKWISDTRALLVGEQDEKQRVMAEAAKRTMTLRLAEADTLARRLAAGGVDPNDHEGQREVQFVSKLESTNERFISLLRAHHPDMETPDHNRVRVKQWRNRDETRSAA